MIDKATNSAKLAAAAAEERLGHSKGRRLSADNAAAEQAAAAAAEAAAEAYARAAAAAVRARRARRMLSGAIASFQGECGDDV